MSTTKRITVTREWRTVKTDQDKTLGEKAGAVAAVVILGLLAVIVLGGLVWVAEAIWRAVL